MSIVAVHGPNTFGSAAVWNPTKTVQGFAVSADGTKWRFIPVDQSKPAAQYDWAWTHTSGAAGGTPASPLNDTMIAEFTFPAGSVKSVILTLNGVAQGAITATVPATGSQVSPMMLGGGGEEEQVGEEPPPDDEDDEPEVAVGYDPGAHTVPEVEEFATDHPDQWDEILAAEEAGKNRVTLVDWLSANDPNP